MRPWPAWPACRKKQEEEQKKKDAEKALRVRRRDRFGAEWAGAYKQGQALPLAVFLMTFLMIPSGSVCRVFVSLSPSLCVPTQCLVACVKPCLGFRFFVRHLSVGPCSA